VLIVGRNLRAQRALQAILAAACLPTQGVGAHLSMYLGLLGCLQEGNQAWACWVGIRVASYSVGGWAHHQAGPMVGPLPRLAEVVACHMDCTAEVRHLACHKERLVMVHQLVVGRHLTDREVVACLACLASCLVVLGSQGGSYHQKDQGQCPLEHHMGHVGDPSTASDPMEVVYNHQADQAAMVLEALQACLAEVLVLLVLLLEEQQSLEHQVASMVKVQVHWIGLLCGPCRHLPCRARPSCYCPP